MPDVSNTALRGKQGVVIIDEAADWGGVDIHIAEDNARSAVWPEDRYIILPSPYAASMKAPVERDQLRKDSL